MSDFKLEFTLQQHTPMIHFQSEQTGATLRATELKPKLDRFLIEYVFEDDFENYKEFLIGYKEPKKPTDKIMREKDFKGKKAFDYKVRVVKKKISDDKVDLNGLPDDRLFMGNMGGGTIQQMYHRNSETIVTLSTFNKELKKKIEENFSNFMFQTNFGGGSSKGFGSFTDKNNGVTQYPNSCYSFKVGSNKLEDVYNSIFYFYKMLKSGINEYDKNDTPIFYGKSFLWSYVNETQNNATWEKKKIKESFFIDELEKQKNKYSNFDVLSTNKKPFLYRDLLGLSLESDWMSYNKTITKKVIIEKEIIEKEIIEKEITEKSTEKSTDISRFPSPIRFKPILEDDEYIIYFWGIEVSKDILKKKFIVSDGSSSFEISTPVAFDIGEYLEFVSKKNLAQHIDKKFQVNNKIFDTLKVVFSTMKKVEQNSEGTL